MFLWDLLNLRSFKVWRLFAQVYKCVLIKQLFAFFVCIIKFLINWGLVFKKF